MSAPAPRLELEVAKPTNRLGRKEPNDDHYRSRFPSRVSANRFAQHPDRRGRGETAGTSRRGGEKYYRDLGSADETVRIGMEASGHGRWFERLVAELQFELWIGDAAVIRAKRGRKQKTDRQDAQHILQLMLKDDFPKIWVPNWENRDLRQLLWHRHRMVQARTRVMNQLQAVALTKALA
jgi:transposase